MHPARLLPLSARIVDPGEAPDAATFVVTDTDTPVHASVKARAVRRSERSTVRDERNRVVTDYDVLLDTVDAEGVEVTADNVAPGRTIELSTGETLTVTGRPVPRRRATPDVVMWSVPCRLERI